MNSSRHKHLAFIRDYKKRASEVALSLSDDGIATLIGLLQSARGANRQILLCGNGGSAATASHFANDLGKGASYGRDERFRAICLTDNIAWLTALANDVGYASVFVQQLRNHAQEGDVLVAFSGSGNSKNVLEAVHWARANQLVTVGLTGRPGGALAEAVEYPIFIESSHMGHIEEGHFLVQHLVGYFFIQNPEL